jgi:cellulose synthase/poly-beta-1,6-N-acetylglucosamine synthase-like glycosyltransferase
VTRGPRAPRVSVLLPVWNAERTLAACLRSLARQSEPRFECVVVDDGSTDASARIVRGFAADDPRFRLVAKAHHGLVAALQAGLAECHAPFVARLDADDLAHRLRLALQLEALERAPELAAVGCHVRVFPRRALAPGLRSYERWLNAIRDAAEVRREAFVECPLAHPTLMFRREALCALGYREMGWPEDYDLLLRALAAGFALGVVPRRLLGWRDGPQRLWRTHGAYAQERFTACKAAVLATGFLAGRERYALWGYGATGKALRRALDRHGKRPAEIVELHPGRLGEAIHGARVVPPERLTSLPRRPLLVSVAGEAPRAEIRAWLGRRGYEEGIDYLCTA